MIVAIIEYVIPYNSQPSCTVLHKDVYFAFFPQRACRAIPKRGANRNITPRDSICVIQLSVIVKPDHEAESFYSKSTFLASAQIMFTKDRRYRKHSPADPAKLISYAELEISTFKDVKEKDDLYTLHSLPSHNTHKDVRSQTAP